MPKNLLEGPESIPFLSEMTDKTHEFSAEEQAQISEIFQLFDGDGSGTIESRELGPALFALGFRTKEESTSQPRLGPGFVQPESSGLQLSVGRVTFDEFAALMRAGNTGRDPTDDVWAAFRLIGRQGQPNRNREQEFGGWGPLFREEVRRACEIFEMNLGEEELDSMMRGAGASGMVDMELFVRLMRFSPWF